MKTDKESTRTVKAVETAFTILELLKESDGMRLTELVDELDMAKSTIHRYLQTLLNQEYILQEGDEYYVSLRFLGLGEQARIKKKAYGMAKEKVKQLAAQTDERTQFLVEEHGKAIYVYRETGSNAVQTGPRIGDRFDLHATAAGKAILANWPDEKVSEYVEWSGLTPRTDNTITDSGDLMREIKEIRQKGYSVNMGESVEGLRAVATAISDPEEKVIGALSVAGPSHRMQGDWFDQELPQILMGYANEVELNLRDSRSPY